MATAIRSELRFLNDSRRSGGTVAVNVPFLGDRAMLSVGRFVAGAATAGYDGRMRRGLTLFAPAAMAFGLVAGCSGESGSNASAGAVHVPRETRPNNSATALDDLQGSWQVTGINGSRLSIAPIQLTFRGNEVEAQSGCVRWGWTYDPATAATTIFKQRSIGPVCERGRERDEQAFERVLNEARTLAKRDERTILISASNGEVVGVRG
jgi:hypothetical protein